MTPEEEKVKRNEIAGLKNSIIINMAHLLETQRQFFNAPKKTLLSKTLLAQSLMGATKFKKVYVSKVEAGYQVEIFAYYALASRQFDCRAESQIAKWHSEGKTVLTRLAS